MLDVLLLLSNMAVQIGNSSLAKPADAYLLSTMHLNKMESSKAAENQSLEVPHACLLRSFSLINLPHQ